MPGATSFTLRDMRASGLCGVVVNTLCNLHKFLALEAHDVHSLREAHATPHLSEWDRWAAAEYRRLTADPNPNPNPNRNPNPNPNPP